MKLRNPERLFGLYMRKLIGDCPCVITPPNQTGQIWRLAESYCFISKEIIFEQYTVMNVEPV